MTSDQHLTSIDQHLEPAGAIQLRTGNTFGGVAREILHVGHYGKNWTGSEE